MHLHWERGGVKVARLAFKKAKTCLLCYPTSILKFHDKDEHEKIAVIEDLILMTY